MVSFVRIHDSLAYSRSDRREAHTNLSRLDRIYADKFLWEKGGSIGIIPSFSFSDHAPLRLVIVLQEQYKNSRYIIFGINMIIHMIMLYRVRKRLLMKYNISFTVRLNNYFMRLLLK